MVVPPMKRRATLIGDHPICTAVSMDDSYEAGDVIGTGSFGIIRKVKRRADGMILARKELNYGRMDERDLRQLTEEVNILEQLGCNDNIVRYHERFVDKPNNMLYILMEYCEGGDLSGLIQRCRNSKSVLGEELVWSYLAQLTMALSDCHSEVGKDGSRKAVILHRDIKPENVFLDKENQLKLGDFGLSKAMAQASMTQTYVGTPYYMSPELINGQPYDIKSDIWALGCLIYELCAGHPPFHEARTQPELAVMIREGKIPDLPKPYTPHLGQVVKAMLKQNPKHRPNTTQLKALDSVKLQIRILELRKVSKQLRSRDQQASARETELLGREQAVLLREQAVLAREQAVHAREASLRASSEALKDAQAKLAVRQSEVATASLVPLPLSRADSGADSDVENTRPRGVVTDDQVLARVASRPSMVPRRPLEERRASSNASMIPFPRMPSSSSLMSLDDTPIKDRRRIGSKSMHDLSGHATRPLLHEASPVGGDSSTSIATPSRSPTRHGSFGRRSDSAARRSVAFDSNCDLHALPTVTGASIPFRPLPPPPPPPPASPTKARPSLDSHRPTPPPPPPPPVYRYDPDEIPSPFLKKMDGSRFPCAPGPGSTQQQQQQQAEPATTQSKGALGRPAVPPRAARASLGGAKPSMASRLLASRAAQISGVEEVGRRLSMARGKST